MWQTEPVKIPWKAKTLAEMAENSLEGVAGGNKTLLQPEGWPKIQH